MKKYLIAPFILILGYFTLSSFLAERTGYKAGDEVIDFSLKNIDGEKVSLADYKSTKGFIVVFTCNHCPYAKAYEDRLIDLHHKYKEEYPVIAINPNDGYPGDSYSKMKKRAKEKGFTFPYLLDDTQKIAKTYGATKTPHVYLLQKENGKNIVKYIGAIDNNYTDAHRATKRYLEDAISSLKAGKNPKITESKAIGCSIKWK